jgi:hypothetical protein
MKRLFSFALFLLATIAVAFSQIPKELQHQFKFDAVTKDGDNWIEINPIITMDVTENTLVMNGYTFIIEDVQQTGEGLFAFIPSNDGEVFVYDPKNNVLIVYNKSTHEPLLAMHIETEFILPKENDKL